MRTLHGLIMREAAACNRMKPKPMEAEMSTPMTPVVAVVRRVLDEHLDDPPDIANALILAFLDNLDREAMIRAACGDDCHYGVPGSCAGCKSPRQIDAALAAVRPCPADATLATKENGDG